METDMTKGRPLPIILKFVLPLFLGNVFQQLYNMADTFIVGHFVGQNALAAVGATGTIMFLVLGFSQGLTTGFTVLTSQCFGAGDMKRLRHSFSNGIMLAWIVVVVMTILSVMLMHPLLKLMNTPAEIYADSYTYIVIICYGTVCSVFYNLFSAYMRAVGNSKMPLYFLIFSAALNVVLDIVFIVVFKIGVAGAAIATVISQGVSAILCLLYIVKHIKVLVPERSDWRLTRADSMHQLRIGIPMALQFGITASGTMIMQAAINLFGSTAVAAFTAANKVNNLVTQGFPSMGQAMASYCGQNYGGGGYKRVRAGVRAAVLSCIIYAIIAGILAITFMKPFVGMFFTAGTDIEGMMPWTRPYVVMCALCYIPLSMIFIFRNAMQGCGYGLLPMLGGVVELFARLIMAALSMHLNNYVLAAACDPAAWVAAGIFTAVAYIFVIKDVKKKIKMDS